MSSIDIPECSDSGSQPECVWQYSSKGVIVYNDYQACSKTSILLPGFNLLPDWVLAVAYGLALVWCFFGIAIISDVFMSSIEVITSLEREVSRKDATGSTRKLTVLVWNASVANLSLMALGSSAPEIMIAIIETVVTLSDPTPGEIGPSTIVGSAAYNLLIISAVCIMAVPEGTSKSISEFAVFIWTAVISLWAYLWLLIVYQFWTPDRITLLEAFLTLAFMPMLIGVAYLLDAKPWKPAAAEAELTDLYQIVVGARGTDESGHEYTITRDEIHDFRKHNHLEIQDDHEIAKLVAHSKHYRGGVSGQVVDLAQAGRQDSKSFPLPGMPGSPGQPFTYLYNDRSSSEQTQIMHALAQLQSNKQQAGVDTEVTEAEVDAIVKGITVCIQTFIASAMLPLVTSFHLLLR